MPGNTVQQKSEPKLPLDDNTLFILLALRYKDTLDLKGSALSVYDWNVNYNGTVLEHLSSGNSLDNFATTALTYLENEFGIVADDNKVLMVEDTSRITEFLDSYLNTFSLDNTLYVDEKKHKECLYNFIKEREPDVFKFQGKYFTYKLLPKNDIEKYNMIHYLGHLITNGTLVANEETFGMYLEKGEWKKTICVQFVSEPEELELFSEIISEEERKRKIAELNAKIPEQETANWRLYIPQTVYSVALKRSIEIPPRYYNLFVYLIEKSKRGNNTISINEWAERKRITKSSAKGELPRFAKIIKEEFSMQILKSRGNGTYKINV